MSAKDNPNRTNFFENIVAIRKDTYFIQKLLRVQDFENEWLHKLYGTKLLNLITDDDVAQIANITFAVSRKLEEGRKCSGILCLIDENVRRAKSFVCLSQYFNLDPNVVLSLLIASPNRAIALQKHAESGEIAIVGFVNACECRRSLTFQIHERSGVSVSYQGLLFAAITPESILTPNDISGQTASRDNRDYLIRRALRSVGQEQLHSQKDLIRFDWLIRCFSWIFRRVWEHGNGGCLIVSPNFEDMLRHIVSKFEFAPLSGIETLALAYRDCMESYFIMEEAKSVVDVSEKLKANTKFLFSERELRKNLEWIGDLSRVDGAVMMGNDMKLFSFGAKVTRLDPEFDILIFDCIGSQDRKKAKVSSIGGTRHQSAASLVAQTNDSFAFVASQDGSATLLTKLEGDPLCAFMNFQYLFEFQAPANLVGGDFARSVSERFVDLKNAF